MKIIPCKECDHDLILLEPEVYADERGSFYESFNLKKFQELTDLTVDFVQDNTSQSQHNVIRGLHYQTGDAAQGKLVTCTQGSVWDVVVDIRPDSKNYLKHFGFMLSETNKLQLWIPPGYAHGFCVLSNTATFNYKTTNYYAPESAQTLRWNDPALGIRWPVSNPLLNPRDAAAPLL